MRKEDVRVIAALAMLLMAGAATFIFSNWIKGGADNAAGPFFSSRHVHEIRLYSNRAEPSGLDIRVGDEVLFIVEEGHHNIAEDRTSRRDARLVSGELDKDTTYSLMFSSPGTVYLYDRQNLDIRITIRIEN